MSFKILYRVPTIFCLAWLCACAQKNEPSNHSNHETAPDGIEKLISHSDCKVKLKSEQFSYKVFEQYTAVERGSYQVLEFLPNSKVTIEEVMSQCTPGAGFWGCREVHTEPIMTSYLKMPKGFAILSDQNEPVMFLEWDETNKKAALTFLKEDTKKTIDKDKLELDLIPCK